MRKAILLLVSLAILAALPVSAGTGYKTRHVLVVIMDGTRLSETFGDPTHKLVPCLWNDLRPQGTLYTNFLNTGITVTRQGHSSIASGTWQRVVNGGPRLTRPTFFEYIRDEQGLPASATWAIFGKAAYSFAPYSSFPTYGKAFAPESAIGLGEAEEGDEHVLAKVKEVLSRDHPAMAFINLGCTDHFGHGEDYNRYTQAVATADRVIAEIWAAVQADPEIRGTTTMIVTNDHGRHDDAHGGYRGHGDTCLGCQRLMFLMLGPDTRAGAVIDKEATLIDICPTIGELLGFQTPLADGRVMHEAFLDFRGINKKEARTEAAKAGIKLLALAERDLPPLVGGRLIATGLATPRHDPAGAAACLGLVRAGGEKPDWLKSAREWAAKPDEADDPVAAAARARVLLALGAAEKSQTNQQAIKDLLAQAGKVGDKASLAEQALIVSALAWGGPAYSQACLERVKPLLRRPEKPEPLALFFLADAAAAPARRPLLAQAALLHLGQALDQGVEPGGLWPETTASCLNLAALVKLQQSGWLKGFQAVDKKQAGKEQDERPAIPQILTDIPPTILQAWIKGKGNRPLMAVAQRIWFGAKYVPFSLDLLKFAVDEKGGFGTPDDRSAAGGFLVATAKAAQT